MVPLRGKASLRVTSGVLGRMLWATKILLFVVIWCELLVPPTRKSHSRRDLYWCGMRRRYLLASAIYSQDCSDSGRLSSLTLGDASFNIPTFRVSVGYKVFLHALFICYRSFRSDTRKGSYVFWWSSRWRSSMALSALMLALHGAIGICSRSCRCLNTAEDLRDCHGNCCSSFFPLTNIPHYWKQNRQNDRKRSTRVQQPYCLRRLPQRLRGQRCAFGSSRMGRKSTRCRRDTCSRRPVA